MAMSKVDYEDVADVVASVSDHYMSAECRELLTMRFAWKFSERRRERGQTAPFDYGKFYARCGVDS